MNLQTQNQPILENANKPSPYTLFSLPNSEKISHISGGDTHTICVTQSGLCYVWGCNDRNQLGFRDTATLSIPTLLPLPNGEKISFITCGFDHTMCLTETNKCYVWGYNNYGQLGLGIQNNIDTPTLLTPPKNEKISFIACGSHNTVCLTESNQIYVCGWNTYTQLGLGTSYSYIVPTLLNLPHNERVSFVVCGNTHTICLTQNRLCYVWGRNNCGQLGLGDKTNRSSPTLFSLPNNENISHVACGSNSTICLTDNGLTYVCGSNNFGQLGLEIKSDYPNPTLLTLPQIN